VEFLQWVNTFESGFTGESGLGQNPIQKRSEMSKYAERYRKLQDEDLIDILENYLDYETEAVSAAKAEVESRKIDSEELSSMKNEARARSKVKVSKRSHFDFGKTLMSALHPLKHGRPDTNKRISYVILLFIILSFYINFSEAGRLKLLLSQRSMDWNSHTVSEFLPMIFVPIATFLLWRREKAGWILTIIFIVYFTFLAIIALLFFATTEMSYTPLPLSLSPDYYPLAFFLTALAVAFSAWNLGKKDVHTEFNVNTKTSFRTWLGSMVGVIIFYVYMISN
jgi:hypothetical protein